jgi:hypothetical protein
MQEQMLEYQGLILNSSVSLGVAVWSMDLLQPQIISLLWWEDPHHLQAIINPKGALALLPLVHSGS